MDGSKRVDVGDKWFCGSWLSGHGGGKGGIREPRGERRKGGIGSERWGVGRIKREAVAMVAGSRDGVDGRESVFVENDIAGFNEVVGVDVEELGPFYIAGDADEHALDGT